MKAFLKVSAALLRAAASAAGSVLLWSLWLVLGAGLLLQAWWLVRREMSVPPFVLRALERRVAESGLSVTFGRTAFDPSGRVLIEDVALRAPSFREPLLTIRAAYARLDPWELAIGNFEPLELRLNGLACYVPGMLSASGRPEALLGDLDATLFPREKELQLTQLTARLAGLEIAASGAINTEAWAARGVPDFSFARWLAQEYPRLSRRLADYALRMEALDQPRLALRLEPDAAAGAKVTAALHSRAAALEDPWEARGSALAATTHFPLRSSGAVEIELEASAEALALPRAAAVSGVRATLAGRLDYAPLSFAPSRLRVAAAAARGEGFAGSGLAATATLRPGAADLDLVATVEGTPLFLSGPLDRERNAATLRFSAAPDAGLLAAVARRASPRIADFLQLTRPGRVEGFVVFAPGLAFDSAAGTAEGAGLAIRGVAIDRIAGEFSFAGTRLVTRNIVATLGGNVARGGYETDTSSRDYRFVLNGRLEPQVIAGWFRPWWSDFFANFRFAGAGPEADVDIRGRWGAPRLTQVHVAAEARGVQIRGVPFEHVRARLFLRPEWTDVLDFKAVQGDRSAHGAFARAGGPGGTYRSIEFDVSSTLDEQAGARILGEAMTRIVAPFRFAAPPTLAVRGRLDGDSAPGGPGRAVTIEGSAAGQATFLGFPFESPRFTAVVRGAEIVVEPLNARLAGGNVSGAVRVTGPESERRIELTANLREARLGEAIGVVAGYRAQRRGAPPPDPGLADNKAAGSLLNLTLSAVGRSNDILSYFGTGTAEISGPSLGEVPLLGPLSILMPFTSLRFTRLQSEFQLEGSRIAFPAVHVTGANSAIEARGLYLLENEASPLSFNAKIYPFGESKGVLHQFIGGVLMPLSEAIEVRLTGTLARPNWALTMPGGPIGIFRGLTQSRAAPSAPSAPPSPLSPIAAPRVSDP